MADEQYLAILKKGPAIWNEWKRQNPEVGADLTGADLTGADLIMANLAGADLTGANLMGADLIMANLTRADLTRADLTGANLMGADLTGAVLFETVLGDSDLTETEGLDRCRHSGPSTLDHRTLLRSGRLPPAFLRGCGLPDSLIDFVPSLLKEPSQFYRCFISYASADQGFAKRLHTDLQNRGVRCWYAPQDMKSGDKIRERLDESIRKFDKLLLILSQHSITSQWVEQEVETALRKEREQKRTILFPIWLDEAVMKVEGGWPALIRNTRHIADFRDWEIHSRYQAAFDRILRDLKTDEPRAEP